MIDTSSDVAKDIPLWVVIIMIVLCSLAGELYRADKHQRLSTKQLFVRVAVRAFTSIMVGIVALAYCLHKNMDIYAVGAITGGLSLLGADMVITIGTAIIKRKVNVQ